MYSVCVIIYANKDDDDDDDYYYSLFSRTLKIYVVITTCNRYLILNTIAYICQFCNESS